MGQDFTRLREKAEALIESKRPDLDLLFKSEEGTQVVYSWGTVSKGIGLVIYFGTSQKEAIERMELTNKILSAGPGKKRTGFGEEAYSTKDPKGNFARLRFRKANVYIEITAPTMAITEDLARNLLKEIPNK